MFFNIIVSSFVGFFVGLFTAWSLRAKPISDYKNSAMSIVSDERRLSLTKLKAKRGALYTVDGVEYPTLRGHVFGLPTLAPRDMVVSVLHMGETRTLRLAKGAPLEL